MDLNERNTVGQVAPTLQTNSSCYITDQNNNSGTTPKKEPQDSGALVDKKN
jgi:hypothetical protein